MMNLLRLASTSLAAGLILLTAATATRGEMISIDFNDLSGTPPFALVGQTSGDALQPWTSEGTGPQVAAGDLTVEVPALSKQEGTPQSVSGSDRIATTATLLSRWTTRKKGNTFWFSFLFRQPGPGARVGLNINNALRIIAVGDAINVTGAEGKAITGLDLNETHMVVGCIEIDEAPSAPETIRVWVDPSDLDSLDSEKRKYSNFSANVFYGEGIMSLGVESYAEPQGEGGTIDRIVLATSLDELKAALTGAAP